MFPCNQGFIWLHHFSSKFSDFLLKNRSVFGLDYEVAELTWENGQLSMHGLGPPRVATKQQPTWEKPRAGGTLESIVNQATVGLPLSIPTATCGGGCDGGVPWFDHHRHSVGAAPSTTVSMDAMVPSGNGTARDQTSSHALDGIQTCVVGSCSGNNAVNNNNNSEDMGPKRAREPRVPVAPSQPEWSSMDNSFSGSATLGRDSRQLTLDTSERDLGVCGLTSTSAGSPENTSSGQEGTKATTADEHDSVGHRKCKREKGNEEGKKKTGGKSSVTTRRSRAAAIHNQSERKRRDKINQRMKTLQKLVPNSSKTDKASMLDEVIEYIKQLQAQLNMMNRMNMSSMMLPLTLQQLQLSMMAATAPMGMGGMGMGMGVGLGGLMDLNSIGRHNLGGISPMLHPAAFMPLTSWDSSGDRLSGPTPVVPDPMSAFLACQSQPMTMDAYSRMAALYQQLNQFPPPASKK